jgi:phenol hydroxylase P0 protein
MKRFEVGDKKKYVRVRNIVRDRFVEFDFAIDDPRLYVELILPKLAFEQFCVNNNVSEMTEEQCELVDQDALKWRYGSDTLASRNRSHTEYDIK